MTERCLLVDVNGWKLRAVDGVPLGACSMCGECCRVARPDCAAENLVSETWDGVPVARCKRYGPNLPVSCALWPLPDSELPDCCTMRPQE